MTRTTMGATKRFLFASEREAHAFERGVELVNDSALRLDPDIDSGTDAQGTYWVVTVTDYDAPADDGYTSDFRPERTE